MEVNLLDRYPTSKRPLNERSLKINDKIREKAREFGKEFFDGDRLSGYGGYYYNPRFWTDTVSRFMDYYNLSENSRILDVGCAKGFFLSDYLKLVPGIHGIGLDISRYAIQNSFESIRPSLVQGTANYLPFSDNSFDLVISINTIHNLPLEECKKALKEISRVSKKDAFVSIDAWRNEEERKRMQQWNLTALTYMHVDDWKNIFDEVGYSGDYYWFIAE